jgi:HEPN domain-containing protein
MKNNNSQYPEDWLKIAETDWKRVERNLREDPALAAFCLQQALEKFLKGFLILRGWELRRIHDLDTLLDEAIKHEPSLENFRGPCQKITSFYFIERYPFTAGVKITEQRVSELYEQVKGLADAIRRHFSTLNEADGGD